MTPPIHFTAREILILVHAIRLAADTGELEARKQEIEVIRDKLNGNKK